MKEYNLNQKYLIMILGKSSLFCNEKFLRNGSMDFSDFFACWESYGFFQKSF